MPCWAVSNIYFLNVQSVQGCISFGSPLLFYTRYFYIIGKYVILQFPSFLQCVLHTHNHNLPPSSMRAAARPIQTPITDHARMPNSVDTYCAGGHYPCWSAEGRRRKWPPRLVSPCLDSGVGLPYWLGYYLAGSDLHPIVSSNIEGDARGPWLWILHVFLLEG